MWFCQAQVKEVTHVVPTCVPPTAHATVFKGKHAIWVRLSYAIGCPALYCCSQCIST
jgi:hypothetical protein